MPAFPHASCWVGRVHGDRTERRLEVSVEAGGTKEGRFHFTAGWHSDRESKSFIMARSRSLLPLIKY